MQERQLDMFASAERRTEELLLRLEMEQRKADQEASLRTRDREFLFKRQFLAQPCPLMLFLMEGYC